MRRILLIACAFALPLGACASIPLTPSSVAEQTKLDEQAAITAHLAYKSFRIAVETGVNAGQIKGAAAGKVAALDNTLYAALQVVDQAYATGNATTYAQALEGFNGALALSYAAIGGK